ncbi:uncharacterized protein C7orf50-like [Ochotona curzoniae]|uniref:uncharacterized protein C7orf50 homolog n=1 Tax=Ochotona curzoniae TaxID=130825 RepID=UPI001B34FFF1|nr:uncharacterized protein C7orf50 homolog [Ochotona curzoniae]XP_040852356.1 uncharacterized protein C7orf50-like [Ochotona curzoniae]
MDPAVRQQSVNWWSLCPGRDLATQGHAPRDRRPQPPGPTHRLAGQRAARARGAHAGRALCTHVTCARPAGNRSRPRLAHGPHLGAAAVRAGLEVLSHREPRGPRPALASPPSRLDLDPEPPSAHAQCAGAAEGSGAGGRCGGARVAGPVSGSARAPHGLDAEDADPTLTPEEKRVLERKLKKERKKEERKRLREAGQAAPAQRSGAELALDYLCGWAQKQAGWRFQKTRQTWLLQHMFDQDKVPDQHFPTLLAYLEGLRGRARELTVLKAEALMQELDAADETHDSPGKVQRLRQVLQLLS